MVGKEKYMQNIDKKLKVASQHKEEIPEQVRDDMKGKFLVPQCPSILVPLKKAAFTLAEVLITLGIIGVVTAMTLPAVINKINDRQNIAALKKIYSVMSQATLDVIRENGSMENLCAVGDTDCLSQLYRNFIKTVKVCEKGGDGEACTVEYITGVKSKFKN